MKKTFQSYLMFWCSLIFGLTFVVFSVLLYFLTSNYLDKAIDESLLTFAHIETGAALELESYREREDDPFDNETPHIHESLLDSSVNNAHSVSERFVQIFTSEGKNISSYSSSNTQMPTNKEIFKDLKMDDVYYESIKVSGKLFRTLYMPIVIEGKVTNFIQVGTFITNTLAIEKKFKMTLIALNLLTLSISFLTSFLLSKKFAAPVKGLTSTVLNVSASNLSERLNFNSIFIEFEKLTKVFNSMLDRIESSFNSQKSFIANASHEINSPITAIKGNIEVMLRKTRSEKEYKSLLHSNLEDVNRLSLIMSDLLTLAMVDDENASLVFYLFSLKELINNIFLKSFPKFREKNIDIELKLNDIFGFGDVDMIRQIVQNIVDNAYKYTDINGTIKINLYEKKGFAFIDIVDNGIGISDDDLPKIFDRFYRADKSRSRATGGSGLGLSIVKELVRLNKGEIFVKSTLGKGSIFTLKFLTKELEHMSDREGNRRRLASRLIGVRNVSLNNLRKMFQSKEAVNSKSSKEVK